MYILYMMSRGMMSRVMISRVARMTDNYTYFSHITVQKVLRTNYHALTFLYLLTCFLSI